MVTDRKPYEVTGTLNPDVTGTYKDAGVYNRESSFVRTPNGWYLWYSTLHNWVITPARGIIPGDFWKKAAGDIEGLYLPQGIATGDATVPEI